MPFPSNFLANLTYPHPKVVLERFLTRVKARQKSGAGRLWSWRAEISPADLYCYLGGRFGPPNGAQNFLRGDHSDNLIHWEWVLDHGSGSIHILGMNFRTELWITGDLPISDGDSAELARLIKADFSHYGKKMAVVRKSLENWIEFVNPYQRLRRAVEKMQVELSGLNLEPETQKISDVAGGEEFPKKEWEDTLSGYSKGLGLCFAIRSMLPVMAEAYVNFVMFVLMRPELKTDERLRDNAIRQPIDVRVKTLHITCIGFTKPIDYSSPECRAYHTLVNERNDLLHGNVVLEKLRFNEVYFHGNVPVFKSYRTMWERSVGVEIDAVGLSRLSNEVETVNQFIEYLTTCMDPRVKEQIARMSEKRDLGWNEDTGRIGLLFSDYLVDMHMVLNKSALGTDKDA